MDLLLAVHALATFALTGLIWTVQVVHYPLMAKVGRDAFPAYHEAHLRRMTYVVAPLMLTEAATAVLLLARPHAPEMRLWLLVGMVLVLANWMVTAFVSVPCHRRLEKGFDEQAHKRLVETNWIRTVLWTARSGILLALVT